MMSAHHSPLFPCMKEHQLRLLVGMMKERASQGPDQSLLLGLATRRPVIGFA